MDWITGIQAAINYIEDHLTEELDYEMIAKKSFSSSAHFQRIFSILCGYTLGEYIRNRRLTLAGADLASGKKKVIDVALKYGYDSPDSFTKAFQRFHSITPSQARSDGNQLRSFSRLSIKISLEGGTMMNYKIETKPEMTLLGYKRHFSGAPFGDARYEQEKNFFMTTRAHQWMQKGVTDNKLSEYFEIRKRIVSEWLVSSEYEVADGPEIAVYHWGIKGVIEERSIEIWIPIVNKR